ncbi:hypothetical protein [Leifsonia aquatica]|uniref:hypothetical protein n=1 Tax=Leifsonia aquatica TaxID=144185 RepID=UPI00046A1195|nr:hypothetical protein [Leifsonia aquatica]
MKADPPTGDDIAQLRADVKVRVLDEAATTRQRTARPALAGLLVAAAAVLIVGGAGTALAATLGSGVFHPIPHSSHRASDPPQTVPAPRSGEQITPEQASLDQLWALAKSELDDSGDGSSVPGVGAGMNDFAAAVAARCYPQLSPAETADLESLRAAYASASGAASLAPARLYFDRATALCM